MSAFIISTKTMHTVVFAIISLDKGDERAWERSDLANELGRNLFAMNERAVLARYGDKGEDMADGDEASYVYEPPLPPSKVQQLKSLRCLLYQCSEGEVPAEHLYHRLDEASHELALTIVRESPEWEKAAWD